MKQLHFFKNKAWRLLLLIEAGIFALVALLRGLSVFSFRLAYLPLLLGVLLMLDLAVFAVRYDRQHRAEEAYRTKRGVALFLLGVALLASIPLFTNYLIAGHDIQFHLFRIEGVRDGLVSGQFPVRIHPNTLYGHGYANPEFYPELLLYSPALLRLAGFSVMGAYKTFLFALNLLTAIVSYFACARIFSSRKAGLVGSAFYTLSLYRLVNLYTRAAIGEASAMTFLPLVALGIYAILFDDTERPGYKRAFLPLLIGMTGLLSTHLLSCEIVLPLIAVCCLVFWRRTFTGKRLVALLTAAGGTILLSLAFLVPMLDFMGYDAYRVFGYSTADLSREAVNIAQLFPLLPSAVGESNAASFGATGEMPLGVGFVSLLVLALYPILAARQTRPADGDGRDRSRIATFCYVASMVLLLMSTNIFPWHALYNAGGAIAQVAGLIQFPWRLHALTTLLMTLLACRILLLLPTLPDTSARCALACALAMLLLLTSVSYCDRLVQEGDALFLSSNADLDQTRSVGDAEYLPEGTGGMEVYRESEPTRIGEGLTIADFVRGGARASFTAVNGTAAAQTVDLPLIGYLGYQAFDSAGDPLPITKGEAARLRVTVPAGYEGAVTVRFVERPLWRAAEGVTLLTFAALVVWYCLQRRRYGTEPYADDGAPFAIPA